MPIEAKTTHHGDLSKVLRNLRVLRHPRVPRRDFASCSAPQGDQARQHRDFALALAEEEAILWS